MPLSEIPSNEYWVIAHGEKSGQMARDSNGKELTAEDLADKIRSDPNFQGKDTVRLMVCHAGKYLPNEPLAKNYAKQLADKLGVKVLAPFLKYERPSLKQRHKVLGIGWTKWNTKAIIDGPFRPHEPEKRRETP